MHLLSVNAKLYVNAGGVGSTWVLNTLARDVTLGLEKSEADVTTRGGGGWKATAGTQKVAKVSFEILWDPYTSNDDPALDQSIMFQLLRNSFLNGTVIGIKCLDRTDGEGFQGSFMVTKFERTEPVDGVLMAQVDAVVTPQNAEAGIPPEWIEPD